MDNNLVSIVVPIYNVEEYLDRCITSIVNQTYTNLEIILVDDGSPDRCPQMCEDWAGKDSRIRVIHKANAGLGMARNTGIEHATGDYICFFDSDDYIEPDTIARALAVATERSAQIVVFGMLDVDKQGNIVRRSVPEGEKYLYEGEKVQTEFLPDLIDNHHKAAKVRKLCLSACSCLFSMELVRKTQWRFVSERELISEDSYSLIWLYQYVDAVAILTDALYAHCENEASLSRAYNENRYPRLVHFYKECLLLTESVGYCQDVSASVSGLFVSFTLAAMKQIAAAPIGYGRKRILLKQILLDDTLHAALSNIADRQYGKARSILFRVIERRLCTLCYLLLLAQNMVRK